MNPQTSKHIAITGGIACGKSTVGEYLRKKGWQILDTDHVAHQHMQPGTHVYQAIVKNFGTHILDAQGNINRSALGNIVFSDAEKRKILNDIVHPAVRKTWQAWQRQQEQQDTPSAVLIPLLFEAGIQHPWDAILCIAASEATMKQRLEQRGLSPEDAQLRIQAQWPIEQKIEQSTHTIWNNKTLKELEQQVTHFVDALAGEHYE